MYPYRPGLQQVLLGGVTGKLLHDDISQSNASKADNLAVDAGDGLGAIDQHSLAVNNLDNGSKLASIRAKVDQNNSADLNESCESLQSKRAENHERQALHTQR